MSKPDREAREAQTERKCDMWAIWGIEELWQCSRCGNVYFTDPGKHPASCPHCGATVAYWEEQDYE